MTDETYGIEVEIDSRPAESGKDRTVRSIEEIRQAAIRGGRATERANERAERSYRGASSAAERMASRFDRTRSRAEAAAGSNDRLSRSTDTVGRRMNQSRRQTDRFNDELTRTERITSKLGPLLLRYLGAAALVEGLRRSVGAAVEFGDAIAEVSTLVDTATFDIEGLTQAALDNAVAFSSTPVQQAQAYYQIISAGAGSAAEATDILTAANRLAVGGVTDVATAADGLTSTLNAYGIAAEQSESVTDAFFVAVRAGKTTVDELSNSIGKVAPLAAQAGVSLEDLLASVAALTKGGISTNESITGVRAVLASIVKPTQEATDLASQLGIEFNAAGLQALGFKGFMDQLVEATGGNTEQLAQLFGGVEALVPVLALAGQAGTDFTSILEDMENRGGATAEAFDKIARSPGFRLGQLLALMQKTAIQLGDALGSVLVPVIGFLVDNFDALSKVALIAAGSVGAFLAITAASNGPLGVFFGLIASITRQFGVFAGAQALAAGSMAAFGTVAGAAVAPVRALTLAIAANPIGALIVALTTVIALLIAFKDEILVGNNTLATLDDVAAVVFSDIATALSDVTSFFRETWDATITFFQDNFGPIGEFFADIMGNMEFSLAGFARFAARAVDGVIGVFVGGYRAIVAAWDALPAALSRIGALAVNGMIQFVESGLNGVIEGANAVLDFLGLETFAPVRIQRLEVGSSNLGASMANAFVSGFEPRAEAYLDSVLSRADARARSRQREDERSNRATQQLTQGQTDLADATGGAADAIERAANATKDLNDENDRLQSDLDSLISRYDPLTAAANEYAQELERIQRLQDSGLIDAPRADFFRNAARDTFQDRRRQIFLDEFDAAFEDSEKKRKFAEELRNRAREAAEEFEQRGIEAGYAIADAIGGRVGGILGDLIGLSEGFRTGDYRGLRNGPLGDLLTLFTSRGRDEDGDNRTAEAIEGVFGVPGSQGQSPFFDAFDKSIRESFEELSKSLESVFGKIFGEGGIFGAGLGSILGQAAGGAAVGSAINPIIGALGLPSSNTGAQIGGAVGSFIPIPGGDILGSIAGSILGGLFGSKSGSATITGIEGISGTDGGSSSRRREATTLAGSVQDGLRNLADRLDATIGTFAVSIGIRKDDFRVDPTGRGNTRQSRGAIDFGSDSAAAVEFAIRDAISDGAIQGLSVAENRVLRNARDLDQAVNAILSFRDIESQIRALEDPVAGVFEELVRNFDDLRSSLLAAGFTASELADLERLYSLQREQALEETTQGFRDLIESITTGSGSGQTVYQQFVDAQAQIEKFRADIAAGRSIDQDEFTSAGQNAFNLARQVFGSSTPEFEAFKADLVQLTRDAIGNVEDQADELAPVVDAINAGNDRSEEQNDEIIDLLRGINDNGSVNPSDRNGHYVNPFYDVDFRLAY